MNITLEVSTSGNGHALALSGNSSGDLVSAEVYHLVIYVCTGYLGLFVSLAGAPSNFVACVVFWKQGLRDRINLCLFSLAFVDFLYLVSDIPFSCLTVFNEISYSSVAGEYFCKYAQSCSGFINGLRATSGCYNMIIGIERCMCVVFPLKAGFLLRTRTMGVLLAVCFIVIQLGYVTSALEVWCVSVEVKGKTQWLYVPTQIYLDNKDLFETIEMSLMTVSLPFIMFICVSVTAVVTAIKLTAALHWRKSSTSVCNDKVAQQATLSKMMLIVSFIYICTMTPFVLLNLTRLTVYEFSYSGRYMYLYLVTMLVGYQCPRIHSASNFFVYYNQSSRFRSVLNTMCCLRKPNKEKRFVTSASLTTNPK